MTENSAIVERLTPTSSHFVQLRASDAEASMQKQYRNWIEIAKQSDIGMRRANNQDAYAVVLASDGYDWTHRGHVFLVADGMGAHAAGELASKMAADGIPHAYHKQPGNSQPEALRKAIEEINAQIYHRGQANVEFQGMGTTTSVLVLSPQGALVAQVGDSRVYRLRGQQLQQLTFDHSLVWEMMAAGQVSQQSVPSFIPKNIITRSLGPQEQVKVDLEGPFPLEIGDTFLLCSDGLTGQLSDEEIGTVLSSVPASEAAAVLVDLANLRGGPDNITVLVVQVIAPAPAASSTIKRPSATGRSPSATPPPILMVTGLAFILFALGVLALKQYIAGLAGIVIGIGLILISALKRSGQSQEPDNAAPTAPLGKAPYTQCGAAPTGQTVAELAQIAEQLKEAASEGRWPLDQQRFDSHYAQAVQAVKQNQLSLAVLEYSHAIRILMGGLRREPPQTKPRADDSVL